MNDILAEYNDGGLSAAEISAALSPYVRRPLSGPLLASIASYISLLRKWNRTIPLTSIEDEREIVMRHFGESLFAATLLPLEHGRLADVGTGAGFPGLALKMLAPALQVVLLESNVKKCAFLREAQATLKFTGVEVIRKRYEDAVAEPRSFDFTCCRALGHYKRVLQWAKLTLKDNGHALFWLGIDDSNAMTRINGWNWSLPAKIPESRRRVILIGRPMYDG
jgi:16S rRNA (guanine527-N7)-methyltransferase